ncbi:MAG TPA: SPOR domain-containing protein [Rhizomicrobium sp.]|nr:SPOR domain-containing protein [Rhizomicrobium sp.]
MPNVRGTYEPPNDDVHVFDAAEDDDDSEGSRLPLLIVIALFVLAAFGGVVWLAYTQGVARGRSDAPKIIAAQPGPAKVAADQSTQGSPYKGLKIYQQPAPADEEADRAPAPPPPQPEVTSPETAVATPHPQQTAEAEPPPAPKATPQIRPTAPPAEATAPPAQLGLKTPSASPPAPAPAAETAAPPAAAGAWVLQIGAYKSEAEADAAWNTYRAKHAATLSGYSKSVKQVDLGAKGAWFRLRVGSFASKDAAAALCGKLTAEGGACFPAK